MRKTCNGEYRVLKESEEAVGSREIISKEKDENKAQVISTEDLFEYRLFFECTPKPNS